VYDDTIKIIVFGDESVDKYKTSLIQRFLTNLFVSDQTMTIGVDFEVKSLSVDGQKIKLQIWDFGGAERLRFLLPTYVRGARGGLFVYDITNYSSIAHIDDWLSVIRKENRAEDIFPILVVGILPDESEERQVTTEQGTKLAESRNLNGFIECNLKTGENVEKAFEALTRLILANEGYQSPIKMKKYFTDPLPDMPYSRNIERDKGNIKFLEEKLNNKFLEEKLNNYIDNVERMMAVILRIPDLVDQSLATVNQKLSTLESQIKDLKKKRDENDDDDDKNTITQSIKDEDYSMLKKILKKKSDYDDDDDIRYPYPYVFKPPSPPDDFEIAPQIQVRSPSKEKDPEDEIHCQYCGMKLTKEEQYTHSCKKKPE